MTPFADDLVSPAVVSALIAAVLRDLSRLEPELAVATATAWSAQPTEEVARLVAHGLRGLVRRGYPGAVELLG